MSSLLIQMEPKLEEEPEVIPNAMANRRRISKDQERYNKWSIAPPSGDN
jgi:hypothetical protein